MPDRTQETLFILAPMDDVTDTVFRQIIHDLYNHSDEGPDIYFTEFVNVDGLMSPGRPKLMKKLQFVATEGPLIAQLWGLKPENFEAIARQIADGTIQKELGLPSCPVHHSSSSARKQAGRCVCGFVGIDLNMGCPAKSEVKNGACSALIQNRPLAKEIIEATIRGAESAVQRMPVSVKTRIGFSEIDLGWIEFLLEHELDMLTLHWRTRKEMSKVPAHWELAPEVVKLRDRISPRTKIIGNGDVLTRHQGEELVSKYNLDGIMIGRGVFHDPYVFALESPWETVPKEDKVALYRKHVQLFADTWEQGERPIHTLNKFCKIYISGFDGAKELREILMNCQSTDELLAHLSV